MSRINLEINRKKKNKGITLISLVVTIIILIILAGIVINLSISNNGIFNKSKLAKEEYTNSAEEEQKQLNDAYGQMLVATSENATVTMTMKELNDLIDERVNSKSYINTSEIIANINVNSEYQATEDCIIAGIIGAYEHGIVYIYIDNVYINHMQNNEDRWVQVPIYFPLKEGQKLKIVNSGKTACTVKAYSTLK